MTLYCLIMTLSRKPGPLSAIMLCRAPACQAGLPIRSRSALTVSASPELLFEKEVR
jgi:hypothetical protein